MSSRSRPAVQSEDAIGCISKDQKEFFVQQVCTHWRHIKYGILENACDDIRKLGWNSVRTGENYSVQRVSGAMKSKRFDPKPEHIIAAVTCNGMILPKEICAFLKLERYEPIFGEYPGVGKSVALPMDSDY